MTAAVTMIDLRSGTASDLPIVDAIMQVHDGAVRLLPTRQGEGARFALTLPLSRQTGR